MALIEIDLYDFDFEELIQELKLRLNTEYTHKAAKQAILTGLKEIVGDVNLSNSKLTLINSMKIDFLINNIDKISIEQLENLIK